MGNVVWCFFPPAATVVSVNIGFGEIRIHLRCTAVDYSRSNAGVAFAAAKQVSGLIPCPKERIPTNIKW